MVCTSWAAVLGSRTRVDADNRSLTNPLTGEPDAGDPPVRFGGRGSGQPLSLPLSVLTTSASWAVGDRIAAATIGGGETADAPHAGDSRQHAYKPPWC